MTMNLKENFKISIAVPDPAGEYRLDNYNASIVKDPRDPSGNTLLQIEVDEKFREPLLKDCADAWYFNGVNMGLFLLNGMDIAYGIYHTAAGVKEYHKSNLTWKPEDTIVPETMKELDRILYWLHDVANLFPNDIRKLKVMVKKGNLPY